LNLPDASPETPLTPDVQVTLRAFHDHPDLRLERRDVQRLTRLGTDRALRATRELSRRGLIQRAPPRPGSRPAYLLEGDHA
jgi:hypothetical protein